MRLNLGCGHDTRRGWVDVDVDESAPADMHLDLEETPWPWDDGSADEILMDNVFEHIRPGARTSVLDELHRVLKEDGVLTMRLPVPEVGGGWEETHYVVPSWRWPYNPKWADRWEVLSVSGSRVGPGRALPGRLAVLATRFWIFRGVDEVEVRATPRGDER